MLSGALMILLLTSGFCFALLLGDVLLTEYLKHSKYAELLNEGEDETYGW